MAVPWIKKEHPKEINPAPDKQTTHPNQVVTSNQAVRLRDKAAQATVGQVAVQDPGAAQDRPVPQDKAVAVGISLALEGGVAEEPGARQPPSP
jgi:hypothetical protein